MEVEKEKSKILPMKSCHVYASNQTKVSYQSSGVQYIFNALSCFSSIAQSTHTSNNGGSHAVKKVQKNFNNYASVECGAKILGSNPEAKVTLICIYLELFMSI